MAKIEVDIEKKTVALPVDVTVAGTLNYNELYNKPRINGVELVGDVTPEDLGLDFDINIDTSDLVTKKELESKGYLTEHQDISFLATKEEIKEVNNKIPDVSGFASKDELEEKQDKGDYLLKSEIPNIPTKVSDLDNDSGFITQSSLETATENINKNTADIQTLNNKVDNLQTISQQVQTNTTNINNLQNQIGDIETLLAGV